MCLHTQVIVHVCDTVCFYVFVHVCACAHACVCVCVPMCMFVHVHVQVMMCVSLLNLHHGLEYVA